MPKAIPKDLHRHLYKTNRAGASYHSQKRLFTNTTILRASILGPLGFGKLQNTSKGYTACMAAVRSAGHSSRSFLSPFLDELGVF